MRDGCSRILTCPCEFDILLGVQTAITPAWELVLFHKWPGYKDRQGVWYILSYSSHLLLRNFQCSSKEIYNFLCTFKCIISPKAHNPFEVDIGEAKKELCAWLIHGFSPRSLACWDHHNLGSDPSVLLIQKTDIVSFPKLCWTSTCWFTSAKSMGE